MSSILEQVAQLVARELWLEPHQHVLEKRLRHTAAALDEIERAEGSLRALALSYERFGLHRVDGGVEYREWAPGAASVAVIGEFNKWDKRAHQCTRDEFGVWTCFVADAADGTPALAHDSRVKVALTGHDGTYFERLSTWARFVRQEGSRPEFTARHWAPPAAATHRWRHASPLDAGAPRALKIYEAHVGMSAAEPRVASYDEFRTNVLPHVHRSGYNCIQLMAVMEHSYYASFGYQVTSFFAPASRSGTPEQLKALVDRAHELGIVVLLDIVHSHASRNQLDGVSHFDGTDSHYFHAGARGEHPQWNSRLFDYGNYETRRFLLSNVAFWLREYRFDGLRFDGVTSMLYRHHGLAPCDFFNEAETDIDAVTYLSLAARVAREVRPNAIVIAEEVSGWPALCLPHDIGGMGFTHRLAMAIPDLWIKYLKHKRDEDWDMSELVYELTNRPHGQLSVAYCVPAEHEILTSRGFMDLDTYCAAARHDESLRIASYSRKRDQLVFERPRALRQFAAAPRSMVELSDRSGESGVSVLVTDEHDLFVRPDGADGTPYAKERAAAIADSNAARWAAFRQRTAARGGVAVDEAARQQTLAALALESDAELRCMCELYGAWLRDGALRDGQLCFGTASDTAAVARALAQLGATHEIASTGAVLVSDARLVVSFAGELRAAAEESSDESMECSGDECAQCVAAWIWTLGKDELRRVLAGFAPHNSSSGVLSAYVASPVLRDELVRIGLMAGYSPLFSSATTESGESWRIDFADASADKTRDLCEPLLRKSRGDVQRAAYDGRVWCFTMPSGFVWTRRVCKLANGVVARASRPLLTGNCESHDQALVGDKTIAFWLMDADMYTDMTVLKTPSDRVRRGIALHKLIRLLTCALGGESWLAFMGNEFGHPEWLDFPREGNGWSFQHCKRQWNLARDPLLRYQHLLAFDNAMLALEERAKWLSAEQAFVSIKHQDDKLIAFDRPRGQVFFVVNLHAWKTYDAYPIGVDMAGEYRLLLDSDAKEFGGESDARDKPLVLHAKPSIPGQLHAEYKPFFIEVNIKPRTALVFEKID